MNLTKEDKEFIKELSHEMNTQDTRCTAQPYGLLIGNKIRQVIDWDDREYTAVSWNEGCDYDTLEEFIEALEEHYEDDDDKGVIQFVKEKCEDIDDVRFYEDKINELLYEPCRVYAYKVVDNFNPNGYKLGNFFLTEREAFNYIKAFKYDLGDKPFTYGIHLNDNHSMKKLIEIVHKLAKGLEDE